MAGRNNTSPKSLQRLRIYYLDPIAKTSYGTETYPHYSELMGALQDAGADVITSGPHGCHVRILGLGYFAQGKGWESRVLPPFKGTTVAYFYKAHQELENKLAFLRRSPVDLIITPLPRTKEYEAATGIPTVLFPYGFDPSVYKPLTGADKEFDVGFTGGLHGSAKYVGLTEADDVRERSIAEARKTGANVFFKGGDVPAEDRFLPRAEYVHKLATTTAWISTNSPHMDIPSRHFQVMACGSVLLCERPHPAYADIFRDGENCIYFESDCSNVAEKVNWLRENPIEAQRIAKKAATEAVEKHTWKKRAEGLISLLL